LKALLEQLIRVAQTTNTNLPGLKKTSVECAYDAYLVWKATFDTDAWRKKQEQNKSGGKMNAVYFLDACPLVVHEGVEMKNPAASPKISRTVIPETFERCPPPSPPRV
jgi:hypothetical protein